MKITIETTDKIVDVNGMLTDIAKLPRFDGASAWPMLTAEDQAAIGAAALEYIVNIHGDDAYFSTATAGNRQRRPFAAAQPVIMDRLIAAVSDAIGPHVPALFDDQLPVPIPSLLGPVCRVCLCSEDDARDGGCSWAEPDLCTACAALQGEVATEASGNG